MKIEVEFNEEEANEIYVGALLVGKGKIWLDNFHLLVDDNDYLSGTSVKKNTIEGRPGYCLF